MAREKKDMEKQLMTQEEAKAFRASLYRPQPRTLSEKQKREEFRVFWAKSKKKYGKAKNLEQILWLHLVNTKNSDPENFEKGLKHFGLKEINRR